ncbi:MAG TPA: hypothetical protein VII78_00090 [Myxococcota bacterium]|jgi:hypothetical protein
MQFEKGDRVRLLDDMYGGEIPQGSVGVVTKTMLVTCMVKFPGIGKDVRVLASFLEPA